MGYHCLTILHTKSVGAPGSAVFYRPGRGQLNLESVCERTQCAHNLYWLYWKYRYWFQLDHRRGYWATNPRLVRMFLSDVAILSLIF